MIHSKVHSKKILVSCLLACAAAMTACGGSNDDPVNETITLADGEARIYTFEDESLYGSEWR
jgi:hypothetical protein